MSNIKQIKSEALSTVDAALSILNKFPDLEEGNTNLSFNTSTNPFQLLMDLFKTTSGYNKLIEILAKFIAKWLPVVEETIKALLITKLKELISCSVNPFITEDILKNGIVFNVAEIDISDVLKYSPFDRKVGQYFYFDTEEAKIPEDLKTSDDMDALIWFMINKSNRRYVWKPKKNRKGREWRDDYPTDPEEKLKKEDGIITFEYYESSTNLLDAEGNPITLQTPYNNCLHVFIGDTRENKSNPDFIRLKDVEDIIVGNEEQINNYNVNIEKIENKIRQLEEDKKVLIDNLERGIIKEKEYEKELEKINDKINVYNRDIEDKISLKEVEIEAKQRFQYTIGDIKNKIGFYFPFNNRNYYGGKTLIEFNIDYIMSLKLFSPKSLAAKLLDALTGMLRIDLSFSYKQQLIKYEVNKMVKMITESDDIVVSDCFFTFSNNDYDAMSRQAELRKAGLLSINGDETSAVKVDSDKILEKLNELNTDADSQTVQTVIEGAINEITSELSDTTYEYTDKVNFGVKMNLIEDLLNSLAYVLVCSVLSPKVYLLLLINLKIIGRQTNFNLEEFIGSYKQLIADIIRSIRDILLNFLTNEILAIIGDLAKEIAVKLSVEQAMYYTRLIKKLIDCFRSHSKDRDFDFNIANVNYADILPSVEGEPKNNDC